MAAPTVPIEIWAEGDVILPNTHELNKARPINDLWNKGWDLGEKPSCEELNYVLNMLTAWAKYINAEQIPGLDSRYLRISQNLLDVADKAAARTNLQVYSKTEADQKFVDVAGDVMAGPLTVPRLNLPAAATDMAYITTTVPSDDTTYLDIVMGDNPGNVGDSTIDSIRFRFSPTNAAMLTMMEINALTNTTALCRVNGNIIASGNIQGSSVNATVATFTNLNVNNQIGANAIQAQSVIATNMSVNNNISATSLNVNQLAAVSRLYVDTNSATVAGRNIVRSVNGVTADNNGDLGILLPDPGVTDVRLGSEISTSRASLGVESFTYRAPSGCVVTGFNIWSQSSNNDEFRDMYSRPIQKYLYGAWYTVGQL